MKNIEFKIIFLTIVTSSILFASGWRLPQSSSKSIALSGAYVANANGADATYYNPANMSFNKNISQVEFGLINISLPSMKYTDNNSSANKDGKSEKQSSFLPSIFFVSKDYGDKNIRYGLSLNIPGGLTRKWNSAYQKAYAQEFSLKIIEINPTIAYKVADNFSIGGGIRAIISSGVVKSDGTDAGKPAIRDMEGETVEYGFNLAVAYKPNDFSNLSATYRSNIDLKEEGNAKLYLSGTKVYDGGASVTVPLPAVLTIAYAYGINEKTTVEFEFDRTYWSAYEDLDFTYKSSIPIALKSAFDDPKTRDWEDTNAFRIGLTHKYNNKLTMMAGFSKDGHPIPEKALSFESPDYNSNTISFGADYNLDESSSLGFGYLYSQKDDRTATNTNPDGTKYLDGKISDVKAHLLSVAYRMNF